MWAVFVAVHPNYCVAPVAARSFCVLHLQREIPLVSLATAIPPSSHTAEWLLTSKDRQWKPDSVGVKIVWDLLHLVCDTCLLRNPRLGRPA